VYRVANDSKVRSTESVLRAILCLAVLKRRSAYLSWVERRIAGSPEGQLSATAIANEG